MANAYHNLKGWLRDVRKAVESGDQLAYEAAELILELDDLVSPDIGDVDGVDESTGESDDDAGDVDRGSVSSDELVGDAMAGNGHRTQLGLAFGVRGDGRSPQGDGPPRPLADSVGLSSTFLNPVIVEPQARRGRRGT